MTTKSSLAIQTSILKLLESKKTISLQDIAQQAGLSSKSSADRRMIQRALTHLIKQEIIQAQGISRARVYCLKDSPTKESDHPIFKGIPLSEPSFGLIHYLSSSTQTRQIVSYQQDFLINYIPNKTAYLNTSQRNELLSIGRVEHIARPAGTYARNILNRLLIDLAWNSSRLEGNTYSLIETKRLIELGEEAAGKGAIEAQMILNHKGAIEYIVDSAEEPTISAFDVYNIHAFLSENLLEDPSASGRIRSIAVGISGSTYMPLENPHVLKEYFDILIEKSNQIQDPFEQSFFSLIHLSYLQAFEDVNKRTARLVSNIPMIKQNLKPLSFIDVNQEAYVTSLLGIYEKNDISLIRDLYIWAYTRSAQRYTAVQQAVAQPNLLKLKYRHHIQEIIQSLILNKVPGQQLVSEIKNFIENLKLPEPESTQLFQIIEIEIISLHEGNIARFKIRPSEFLEWQKYR